MSFSSDLQRFANKARRNVVEVQQETAVELFSAIILSTPVDTGRLRGNWQVSINTPEMMDVEGAESLAAQVVVQRAETEARKSKAGDAIYMVNNLPYAPRIEYDGWSSQAPEGMVRKNVIRFQAILRRKTRELNP